MSFNYLDIIIAIPLVYAIYKGFTKGLIVEVAGLAALLLGIYGAYEFSDLTADFLRNELLFTSSYLGLISFALTFLIILLIVHLIAKLITKVVEAAALGIVNRLTGVLFAVLKMTFILSILFLIIENFDDDQKVITAENKNSSLLYNSVSKLAPSIFPYLKIEQLIDKAVDVDKKIDEKKEELVPNP